MSNKHLKVGGQGGTADPKKQSQDKSYLKKESKISSLLCSLLT